MRPVAKWMLAIAAVAGASLSSLPAHAQEPPIPAPPTRSESWDTATTLLALSASGLQLLMPRVFYSDPEVTVGWKARWHLSVLAPAMTLATLSLINEQTLKESLKGYRPGCQEENQGAPGCTSFGMFSTHSFVAFSALGQGAGIFLIDTTKWSGGRFNGGAFAGHVAVPLVLAVLTAIGRSAGEWESSGQVWASGAVGVATGFALGTTYALLQRPECGYSGSLLCW